MLFNNLFLLLKILCDDLVCIVSLACCSTKMLVTRRSWRMSMNVSHGCLAPTGQQPPYRGLMSYVHCSVSDSHPSTGANLSFFFSGCKFFPLSVFHLLYPLPFPCPFSYCKAAPSKSNPFMGSGESISKLL